VSNLPSKMRTPRHAGKAHYYIDPSGVSIYPNGLGRLRFTRRQMQQAIKIICEHEHDQLERAREDRIVPQTGLDDGT
jgi:hypothetical protein